MTALYTIPKSVESILFDFDGTLVEDDALLDIWRTVTAKWDLPFDEGRLAEAVKGRPAANVFREIYGTRPIESQFLATLERVEEEWPYELLPGVRELMGDAHQRGKRIGIVSNSWTTKISSTLRRHSLIPYVDSVIGRDAIANPKPHPAPYIYALNQLANAPRKPRWHSRIRGREFNLQRRRSCSVSE